MPDNTDDKSVKVKNVGEEIEKIKKQNPALSYIECVIVLCEVLNLDVEDSKRFLPRSIKEKIEAEALERNLLNYKINTLL